MLRTEDMSVGLANLMLNVTPYRYHDYYWTPPERSMYPKIERCRWKRYFGFHKVPLKDVKTVWTQFEQADLCYWCLLQSLQFFIKDRKEF